MLGRDSFIEEGFNTLLSKLTQSGEQSATYSSGTVRSGQFQINFSTFLDHPWTGIGYGLARSADLFSSLLVDVGLIGFIPFVAYIIIKLKRLFLMSTHVSDRLFLMILSSICVMLVSVPELSIQFFWIYLAMSEILTTSAEKSIIDERIGIYSSEC